MKASKELINHIKHFEGLRLRAYQDTKGVWTIGYGHTNQVKSGDSITREEAEILLKQDLSIFEDYVNSLDVCNNNQGRFDALVDFVYNCGIKSLDKSTLLKYIRENRCESDVRAEFSKWVYSGGRKLIGLMKRRRWEANSFFNKKSSIFERVSSWLRFCLLR